MSCVGNCNKFTSLMDLQMTHLVQRYMILNPNLLQNWVTGYKCSNESVTHCPPFRSGKRCKVAKLSSLAIDNAYAPLVRRFCNNSVDTSDKITFLGVAVDHYLSMDAVSSIFIAKPVIITSVPLDTSGHRFLMMYAVSCHSHGSISIGLC